jgi:hypothetical protein
MVFVAGASIRPGFIGFQRSMEREMLALLFMAKRKRYGKSADRGIFDSMDRVSRIDSTGDPLAQPNVVPTSL